MGPDILCWGSSFFQKEAHDPGFVSWHQDSTYYGLEPPDTLTAWIAISDSNHLSGCMAFVPGSHNQGIRARLILRNAFFHYLCRRHPNHIYPGQIS